ncbi:hypothetical protein BTR14_20080 [Rhizobium rhizosphaerae]|uniref:Serine hydrolase family protein n=1 Tax=Xaviernesmea rhizosphaerae TaxID=1672749 RepID=A0ABX3P861_9HYPH|nr:alpha/beta hydrolase [Xaviernesmea rhizosphaerae]OQP84250.1 hypothetical protein BTR14_20080 [Xaviernesmea rhizosphaerae]
MPEREKVALAKAVIVHGYMANPSAHWFPWLGRALERHGLDVTIAAMPESQAPRPDVWAETLQVLLPEPDETTLFIGHSLGCITLLRHLSRLPAGARIGGYVLVSGFDRPLPNLPDLDDFTTEPLDYDALKRMTDVRLSIYSDNDTIVDPAYSRALAAALNTAEIERPGAGHFLASEGVTELPEIVDWLPLPQAVA